MGNNMNAMQQRDMMHQREMMYQKDMRMPRNPMQQRNMNCNCDVNESCMNPRMRDDRERNRPCCDDSSSERDMLYGVPLTMAYVPWQNFGCTYEPAQGLQAGTIFPELDKPFYGRKGMRL